MPSDARQLLKDAAGTRYRRWPERQLVPVLLILLVLAWQSFFVQVHVHPLINSDSAAIASHSTAHLRASAASASHDDADTCALCLALAQAENTLLPSLPVFVMPIIAAAMAFLLTPALWARRDRSHAWLGRGPPHHSLTLHA